MGESEEERNEDCKMPTHHGVFSKEVKWVDEGSGKTPEGRDWQQV